LLKLREKSPIPTPFTKDDLFKLLGGCLNEYLNQADNKLRAGLETIMRRRAKTDQLDETLPFTIEFASPPEKSILLGEINSAFRDCLTDRERQIEMVPFFRTAVLLRI